MSDQAIAAAAEWTATRCKDDPNCTCGHAYSDHDTDRAVLADWPCMMCDCTYWEVQGSVVEPVDLRIGDAEAAAEDATWD